MAHPEFEVAVAKDACAGYRIIDFVARDSAGIPIEFSPYQERSFVQRVPDLGDLKVWIGQFRVAGKTLHIRVSEDLS